MKRGPREGFDVSFYLQTLWIELGIIMTTYTLIRLGIYIYRKMDEEERGENGRTRIQRYRDRDDDS